MDFTGEQVLGAWARAGRVPGGRWLLSVGIGWAIPYTGTIRPRIQTLEAGLAEVSMPDRWAVRNHLRCVHALALGNLAEFTGSLAMVTRVPEHQRWIVTGLDLDYLKKARGRLLGRCDARELALPEDGECQAEVEILDAGGEVCTRARVRLRVGPKRGRAQPARA